MNKSLKVSCSMLFWVLFNCFGLSHEVPSSVLRSAFENLSWASEIGFCLNSTDIEASRAPPKNEASKTKYFGVDRVTGERGRLSSCIWNLGFFPNDARKNCPFVLTAF